MISEPFGIYLKDMVKTTIQAVKAVNFEVRGHLPVRARQQLFDYNAVGGIGLVPRVAQTCKAVVEIGADCLKVFVRLVLYDPV